MYNGEDYDDLEYAFNQLSISKPKQKRRSNKKNRYIYDSFITKIVPNLRVLNIHVVRKSLEGRGNAFIYINNALSYKIIDKSSTVYREIKADFAKQKLIVKSVMEVVNPYLKQAFELKRKFEYEDVDPLTLYHGTKQQYIDNICTYNFNWRLSGVETGHRYGKGVNFSTNPFFASLFGNKGIKGAIIIAEVLIMHISDGRETLLVPPKGFDTTMGGRRKQVFIKFYDNEFYPKYIVNFVKISN